MTIALWCVLTAGLLPYVFVVIGKSGGLDNHSPRQAALTLAGVRQRAYWAHQNGFEAFPLFAAAVIVNHMLRGPNPLANELALAFVGLRVVYGALYMANLASLRSLCWFAGIACVIALFATA
jgi:uncharacterized MAPEG superfamily protein